MLSGDFFNILNLVRDEGSIRADIQLNPSHAVYSGHFPGMPVVPGVCQIQIMKEVLCGSDGDSSLLAEAKVCKFINMMDPYNVSDLVCELNTVELSEGEFSFSGTLFDANRIYLKIKGIMRNSHG